jgi:hypothetical protein
MGHHQACQGQMVAAVRRFRADEKPQLWWNCETCMTSEKAFHTAAMLDPHAPESPENLAESLDGPLSAEIAEMNVHIKAVMSEQEPE